MTLSSPTLRKVTRNGLCSGCGACAAIAPGLISMGYEGPGLLRPEQRGPVTEDQEKGIRSVCPGIGLVQEPLVRKDHLLWGPITDSCAGYAADPNLRRNASSGGALSALLVYLLESGTVDAVMQTSASPDLAIGNTAVVSTTPEDVFRAAGSRYAPSAPLAGIEAYLDGDRRFAFVGKPCDVAALRALERLDPRVGRYFPVMLSFFCAGVPSLAGARKILQQLDAREADVTEFRYRGDGWPGFATAKLTDGSARRMSYSDSWGGILSKHVQFRCKICPDGTGGFADIVCADAWETDEKGYPVFEERDGQSLILSRTDLGKSITDAAREDGAIVTEPFDIRLLESMQPGQTQKRRFALARLLALRILGRPAPKYEGFHLVRNAMRAGILANLKNFIGTGRRVIQGNIGP